MLTDQILLTKHQIRTIIAVIDLLPGGLLRAPLLAQTATFADVAARVLR